MNPDKPSREDIEQRITALLLGELPENEAALLRYTISQDAELAKLHERLRQTVGFTREAVTTPAEPTATPTSPLRLSEERRQRLLAHFKTAPPRVVTPEEMGVKRWKVPLREIAAAAAVFMLIAGLAAISIPNFVRSRATSQANAVINNMRQIDAAKNEWALENHKSPNDVPTMNDLTPYLGNVKPVVGESYVLGKVSEPVTADMSVAQAKKSGLAGRVPGGVANNERLSFSMDGNLEVANNKELAGRGVNQPYIVGSTYGTATIAPTTPSPSAITVSPPQPSPSAEIVLPKSDQASVTDQTIALSYASSSDISSALRDLGRTNPSPDNHFIARNEYLVGGGMSFDDKTVKGSGVTLGGRADTDFGVASNGAADQSRWDLQFAKNDTDFNGISPKNMGEDQRAKEKPLVLGDVPISGHLFQGSMASGSVTTTPGVAAAMPAPPVMSESISASTAGDQLLAGGLVNRTPSPPAARPSGSKTLNGVNSFENETTINRGTLAFDEPKAGIGKPVPIYNGLIASGSSASASTSDSLNFDSIQSTNSFVAGNGGLGGSDRSRLVAINNSLSPSAITPAQTPAPAANPWGNFPDSTTPKIGFGLPVPNRTPASNTETMDVNHALDRYAQLTGRTLLRSGLPSAGNISLPKTESTKEEIQALQLALAKNNVSLVNVGDKFLKAVPSSQADAAGAAIATEEDRPIPKVSQPAPIPQPEFLTRENTFSTFSLNVSDVSFKLAAASLERGQLPEPASIRSEEFINAFDYRDPEAKAGSPIAFTSERARDPFAHNRDFLRFSIKAAAQGRLANRPLNLVLLLDNSGSMERADRVQIIREALRVLASQLHTQDTISVITFARTARLWADGVPGDKAGKMFDRVGGITPEGGTNLEEAMNLAYQTALRHYLANGANRVVLLTDGAANLGDVNPETLKQKVESFRKQGIALDCFGIGWEGYNDDLLEVLSSNGDGRYGFLNTPDEAATGFAGQLAGALKVAASDVKVQVEFNPKRVTSWRQIGYAKHQLTRQQFRDNTVDAGEIAAQEAGNALYTIEVNPNGEGSIATVRVRYKVPGTTDYREQAWDVPYTGNAPALEQSSPAMRLAATAGAFSEWLASSPFAQDVTPDELLKDLNGVPQVYGADKRPAKLEWMIRQAKSISGK